MLLQKGSLTRILLKKLRLAQSLIISRGSCLNLILMTHHFLRRENPCCPDLIEILLENADGARAGLRWQLLIGRLPVTNGYWIDQRLRRLDFDIYRFRETSCRMILRGVFVHILISLSLHLLVLPRFLYDFLIHLHELHDDSILFLIRYFPGLASLKLLNLLHSKVHNLYLGRLV